MPNWCTCDAAFTGSSSDLEDLQAKLDLACELANDPVVSKNANFVSGPWLGNIILAYGGTVSGMRYDAESGKVIETVDPDDPDVHCRGYMVADPKAFNGGIVLSSDMANEPSVDLLDYICGQYGYGISYALFAYEPNSDIFINTDADGAFFKDRFRVVYYDEEGDYDADEFYSSKQEIVAGINATYGKDFKSLEQADAWAGELDESPYEIREFDYEY